MIRRLRRWWVERRRVTDFCEVCGCDLTRRTVRELRSADQASDQQLGIGGVGGTYMVATYCKKHFPA